MNEHHMARIFGDICLAMHHIHSKGIVHRDVRSDNILLTSDGKAKLTDFTHATSLSLNEKRSSVVGTAYWMAPEVIKAEPYDQKADIWSLGAVLYELAEGIPPRVEFPALRAITLTVQLGLPALQDPQKYSRALKECLAWCSELQPENRPSADMILEGEFVACASS
ncbi:kinase-like protein, partial [Meira miltonrushii]